MTPERLYYYTTLEIMYMTGFAEKALDVISTFSSQRCVWLSVWAARNSRSDHTDT
jgi:hypothetical protein